jgi:FolB domain-containing protein
LKTGPEYDGDVIRIEQIELLARIGVPDDERAQPQRLTINIAFWPNKAGAELNDDIAQAVNYAAVCAEVRKFAGGRSDKLIETLADKLAFHLLEVFGIRRITIELRKYILPEVEFVSVTVTRERAKE